jgi:hypothetical protein
MSLQSNLTAAFTAVGAFCKRLKEVRTVLATSQAFSSIALANVTGFTFNTAANKKYLVRVWANYSAAAVTTGIGQGYSITGTANVWAAYLVTTSAAGAVLGMNRFNNPAAFVVTASPATTGNTTYTEFRVESTTAGVFQYMVASEVNASAITLQPGSVFTVTELPG